jgi:hypothetical protein
MQTLPISLPPPPPSPSSSSRFRFVGITEFIANVQREKDEAEKAMKWEAEKQRITGVLDPVTVSLVDYQDAKDLLDKTDAIYDRLDEDESGGLTFEEFKAGLKRLPCAGNIHFTEDDFDIITEYGRLLHSPEKPEFNKMQFRSMMQNELFRFARRNLTNALQESEGEEFRQLVLMLKLMETNLTSKLDKTATCSCKAAPEGDLRTMQMLESVVKGQRDLQKQFLELASSLGLRELGHELSLRPYLSPSPDRFLELASRLDNAQSGGTNDQAQIVNRFGYRETRGVDDRLCSTSPRAVSRTAAPDTEPSRQKEVVCLTHGALEVHQKHQKMLLKPFENEIDMGMSHMTVEGSSQEGSCEDVAVDSSETTFIPMLRRPDQSKYVEDGPPPLPHLSSWPIAAPNSEDQQYLPKDRELSEANEIQMIISETGILEAKKSALPERLKLRRDNNASKLDRSQRRPPSTDFPRTCPAEMTRTWPADDMAGDSFERNNSRHRSRQDKSNHVQGPPYLPKEQEHWSLLAPQNTSIGGHAVQQLQLHRAQSKSRQSPSNSIQDEQYLPKDQELWPLPALQNQLKRAQSLKNVSEMTSALVFKSDPTTLYATSRAKELISLHSSFVDTKATLDAIADAQRLQREASERQEHMAALEAQRLELSLHHAYTQLGEARRGQESVNDKVFECSCAPHLEHH